MKTRSEEREERRKKKTQRTVAIVSFAMIGLMVFSSIGYLFTGSGDTTRYNGHTIRPVADDQGRVLGYTTKIDGQQYSFYSKPEDSLGIPLPPDLINQLQNADIVVFLFDPTDNLTGVYDQLRFDFQSSLPEKQASALLRNDTTYPFPVLSCADAAPGYPFLVFAHGNRSITAEGNCYTLAGTAGYDFALLRDRIVYAYHGITEN